MKPLILIIISGLIPYYLIAQSQKKAKMFLDKTYQIDSALQPYFGIQREIIQGIALIDEYSLKENTENISTTELHAVRDPFLAASSFQFSALHFRAKGLPGNFATVTVNGIPMEDLSNGNGQWNYWQGLNGVFRIDENSNGFLQNSFGVSFAGSANNIDNRASKQRAQTNFDMGFSNRSYSQRIQFTHSSGFHKNGWAFAISLGAQYTAIPKVPGTFHNALNGYLGIDKQVNKHLFSIAIFATDFQNARQAYTLKETSAIFDNPLYNPNWGYQNQQVRNANISSQCIPVVMLTHEWKFSNQSFLQTAISVAAGFKNNSSLNWFHAPDPRPDYYRYLPSFQTDPAMKDWVTKTLQEDLNLQQINWDKLFSINRSSNETVYDANGIAGNTINGKMAKYLVENKRTDLKNFNLASSYHARMGDAILIDMGFSASLQQAHYYKTVGDLLGADFFVNWNQFAENEVPDNANAIQFDLQSPNRILKKGDQYGYDYSITHTKTNLWLSTVLPIRRFQISLAGQIGTAQFWRTGNTINGLFPDHSFGKSIVNQFLNTGVKLGIGYAFNGKHHVYFNASTTSTAPYSGNVFISPSTRDTKQENLQNEIVYSAELGYLIQTKLLKIHSSCYFILSKNGMDVLSFYHDAYNSFVNYAISGIGQTHIGYEFGMEARINNQVSILAAATDGQHLFNTRQYAIITADNTATEIDRAIIYAKNYPSINSPQRAYSLSFNYRTKNKWFTSVSGSLFDNQWIGWNPIRRTAAAIFPIDPLSEKGMQILHTEKLPAISLMNIFLSYSFRLGKKKLQQFSCSVSINNLLNRQNIVLAANEQLRFDFDNKDPNKFPPKYLHAVGRNFLISMHYSF